MQAVLTSATRLGVLGGTFDPIHYGHLALAEEARGQFGLDAVLFIPAGEPPHKPHGQADAEQRYLMTVLATADHPAFFVSRLELERAGLSYTVQTLQTLHDLYPQAELTFLLGADAALEFPTWRAPAEIMRLARVVAASRPGFPLRQLHAATQRAGLPEMAVMPVPGLEISSTELRERLRQGQSVRYLTPDAVVAYLQKAGLYAGPHP